MFLYGTDGAAMTTEHQYTPEPRIWNALQVAARLGIRDSAFYSRRSRLETMGFPQKDDELGGWHAAAIDAWLDNRGRVGKYQTEPSNGRNEISELIANADKNAA